MPNLGEMGAALGALLKEKEQTIAIAETSAGGLISAALLSVPGASSYFLGGGVLYTYESRNKMLALPQDTFEGMRPSTEEYALRIARVSSSLRRILHAALRRPPLQLFAMPFARSAASRSLYGVS